MKTILALVLTSLCCASAPVFAESVAVNASPLSGLRVWPNPHRSDQDSGPVHFAPLPDGATVKIFTISGHWVRTLSASGGEALWDRANDAGEPVASGIYLYLITDAQGDKTTGKLAIVR